METNNLFVGNLFAAGGVVMWPLLGFSVLAIALIIERSVFWFRIRKRQRRVVREVLNLGINNVVAGPSFLRSFS